MGNQIVLHSFLWKFCERSSIQFFQFFVMLLLAAFINPIAFGEILLIMSVVTITNICITGGLHLSLIQNVESSQKDFSTLFYFNFIIAIVLYSLLYFLSPFLSPLFEIDDFVEIIRVLGLLLFISSFQVIQQVYIMKHQQFRLLFFSTLLAALSAAIVVIIIIKNGGGVWAFVAWHIAFHSFQTLILHLYIRWLPTTRFSLQSIKKIMGFGWKLTASSLLDSAYTNGQYIFIGNYFSPRTLAFYNRGEQFPNLLINNLNGTLQSVLLPQLAKHQNNVLKFKKLLRNSIATSSFLIFPLLFCLATFADPLIKLLFQDTWLPLITFVQLFCFLFAFWPVHTIYLQAINALGRSDIYLKLELFKKIFSIVILLIAFPFGIKAVIISLGILSIVSLFINGLPLLKLVNYSISEQFQDIAYPFMTATLLTLISVLLQTFLSTNIVFVLVTILLGIFLYTVLAKILQFQGYISIKAFFSQLPLYKEKIILRKRGYQMSEIGGYLEFEQLVNNEYYSNLIRLNSAKNALYYVILAKKIKKIYIPYLVGDSIASFLSKRNIDFEYYSINEQFHPPLTLKVQEDEYLYVVNFYGQLTNARIHQLKVHYERIIVDNTQAFFQKPVQQVDTIYSCRKFFGVPDGAYLSTNNPLAIDLKVNEVSDSMQHLLGRVEHGASEYYEAYFEAEQILNEQELMAMSKITTNMLGALPYEAIVEKRNENYQYLHSHLSKFNEIQLITPFAPFCYPLYIKNAQPLRKRLLEKKIYIPQHWEKAPDNEEVGAIEKSYAVDLLQIPCDQRYSPEQLSNIIFEIEEWMKIENGNLLENV